MQSACLISDASPALQTLKALIEKCWHPNPERRPSFLLIINELSKLLDNMPRKVSGDMPRKRDTQLVLRAHRCVDDNTGID